MPIQVACFFIYLPPTPSPLVLPFFFIARCTFSHDNISLLFSLTTASAEFFFTQRTILIDISSRCHSSPARWIGSQLIAATSSRPGSRQCQVGLGLSRMSATIQIGCPRCRGHLSTRHLVVTRLVFEAAWVFIPAAASAPLKVRNSRTSLNTSRSRRMSLASSRYHFFIFLNLRNELTFLSDS